MYKLTNILLVGTPCFLFAVHQTFFNVKLRIPSFYEINKMLLLDRESSCETHFMKDTIEILPERYNPNNHIYHSC